MDRFPIFLIKPLPRIPTSRAGLSWLSAGRRRNLLPALDRHAEFRDVVAFPLPPIGFAQARRHRLASVLNAMRHGVASEMEAEVSEALQLC